MSTAVYDEFWEEFILGDHISREPRGEGVALVLLVWLEDREVIERTAQLQRTLTNTLSLDPIPRDALHITVRFFGELAEPPEADDQPEVDPQIHPDRVPGLVQHLRAVLKGWGAFPVVLRRINSFFICPFIEVHDEGEVNRIRDALEPGLRGMGFRSFDYGQKGFVPHLTLGYYNEDGDGAAAREALARLRHTEVGAVQVDRLTLIKAPWSEGMYRLETVEALELG